MYQMVVESVCQHTESVESYFESLDNSKFSSILFDKSKDEYLFRISNCNFCRKYLHVDPCAFWPDNCIILNISFGDGVGLGN